MKFLSKYLVPLVIVVCALFCHSCGVNDLVPYIEAEYPNCDVVKVVDDPPYTEATLLCPGSRYRVVRFKKTR